MEHLKGKLLALPTNIRLGLKGASLGYAPALLANIRLGWKDLPGTNTQAYYFEITAVKNFITLAPVREFVLLNITDSIVS